MTGERFWFAAACLAHTWFRVENDIGLRLVIDETGGCRDGLHPGRVNANQGAESTPASASGLDMREAWATVPQAGPSLEI